MSLKVPKYFLVIINIVLGYASFDYEDSGYMKSNLVRLDVLLNGKEIQELSTIRY